MANAKFLTYVFLMTSLLLPSLFTPVAARISRRSIRANPTATIAQFLNPQNKIRAQHGLPPLQWSTKLANFARWYANQRRGDCALVHSVGDYGENIFWGSGRRWKPSDAIREWAAEESIYDYKNNRCVGNQDCYHYTQIVWRSTARVGCAKVICRSGDTFITCNYDPHGNVIGQRPY